MRTFAKNNNILQTDDAIIARALLSSGYTEVFETKKTIEEPEKVEEIETPVRTTRKRQRLDAE